MKANRPKFSVYAPVEMLSQFKAKAQARNLTLSAWAVQAMLSYERKSQGKTPESSHWPSGWRKDIPCHVCTSGKKFHDPQTEHNIGAYDEHEIEMGKVWK